MQGKTTNETELMATSDSTDHILGDRWIMMELGFQLASDSTDYILGDWLIMMELGFQLDNNPTRLFMDNNATLTQTSMMRYNLGRTRHLRANFFNTMYWNEQGQLQPRRLSPGGLD